MTTLMAGYNFRDLGGARTKDGRRFADGLLYRSGLLSEMPRDELRELETRLGIRTVVDIRRGLEHDLHAAAAFERAEVIQVPLVPHDVRVLIDPFDSVESVAEWYRRQMDVAPPAILRFFEILEERGDEPVLFHCHAGKDRTGVLAAVLFGALGVTDEDIVADYAASGTNESDSFFATLPPVFREARREVMEILLETVRNDFGSMREYLSHVGVTESTRRALESRYLVDGDSR